jgi:FMN phosphatase YigB (HAD superfamily)
MSAAPYRAVLFDLFDTLVVFDRTQLPELQVNGRTVRSTAGMVHAALRPFAPQIALEGFVDALLWSWQQAEHIRDTTHREVSAPERFDMLLRRLDVDPQGLVPEAIPTLLATHGRELSRAVTFPGHHRGLLERLRATHRLGVVSNFDYTPTARLVLEREGVVDLFETIVVSDEVGWRKPKPVIFERALQAMSLVPEETLFVGDRPDIDVLGAQAVGMHAVWINRPGDSLPEGQPRPEFEIRDLAELERIVGG